MRVKNAATAAPTIFNLFFTPRWCCCCCCCCRPAFADITHTHHWPQRLSWGFLWSPLPSPLQLQLQLPLPSLLHHTPNPSPFEHPPSTIDGGNQCTYVPWSWPSWASPISPTSPTSATGHCWPVCLHALSHLGISLAFCSFFERSLARHSRPMVAVVVRVGAVPLYIFIYFIFHSRTHAIKLVKNALPLPCAGEKTNKR